MKKHNRKLLAFLMAAAMAVPALASCGESEEKPESSEAESSTSSAAESNTESSNTGLSESKPESKTEESIEYQFDEAAFMEEILYAVDCLYSCDEELYNAQVDFDTVLKAGYKDKDGQKVLSALYFQDEALPEGCESDPADANYYFVQNFNSLEEVRNGLRGYMTDELISQFPLEENFLEFDGKLYLQRGGRGYGTMLCMRDTLAYTGEEDGYQTAKIDYQLFDEYSHTCRLYFEQSEAGWRIAEIREVKDIVG